MPSDFFDLEAIGASPFCASANDIDPSALAVDCPAQCDPARTASSSSSSSSSAATSSSTPELAIGMCFSSRKELKTILEMMAIRDNWEFICVKSNVSRYTVRCKDPSCSWYLHSSRPKSQCPASVADGSGSSPFIISVYRPDHTCSKRHEGNCVASSPWVARRIISKILDNPSFSPHDIIRYIYTAHGVTISYKQAWRAKDCAMQLLRKRPPCYAINDKFDKFCHALESQDPSARAIVDVIDKLGRGALLPDPRQCNFRRMFWTFGAAINGITFCRPVIGLGRIERLRNSNVVMLVATTRDAEDQQFPVAFAFTRYESEETWTWFLSLVREALVRHLVTNRKEMSFDDICDFVRGITFVSDYRFGLAQAVNNIFPDNVQMHALCLRFLYAVVGVKYGTAVANAVMRAAAANTRADFDNILSLELSIDQYEWITSQWPPSIWAESHFRGKRFGILDANMARLFVEWDFVPGHPEGGKIDSELLKCPALHRPAQRGLAIYSCPCIMLPADQIVQRLNVGLSALFSARLRRAKLKAQEGRALSDYADQYMSEVRRRVKSHIARVETSEMGSTWRVRLGQYPPANATTSTTTADAATSPASDQSPISPTSSNSSTGSSSPKEDIVYEKVLGDDGASHGSDAHLNPSVIAASTDYAREYVVDFALKHCSCMAWSRTGLPCEHVLAVLCATDGAGQSSLQGVAEKLVDRRYCVDMYAKTYEVPIEVIKCD